MQKCLNIDVYIDRKCSLGYKINYVSHVLHLYFHTCRIIKLFIIWQRIFIRINIVNNVDRY